MVEKFLQMLGENVHEWGIINTSDIKFLHEVTKACEANLCGRYNACHTCPPASGTLEENKAKITSYSKAFIFTTVYRLEDSFDYEGMQEGNDKHDELTRVLHREVGAKNPVYGAGGCRLCSKCSYPSPCIRPDEIFVSIEACGINVTDLAKSAKVRYNNGTETVTYFSMILFN